MPLTGSPPTSTDSRTPTRATTNTPTPESSTSTITATETPVSPATESSDLPTPTTDPFTRKSTQSTTISSPTSLVTGQSGMALGSDSIGPAVGGAVGGLLVVIAILIVVVIIALLFIKRGRKGSLKVNDRKESVQGYNNALYDGKKNTVTDMRSTRSTVISIILMYNVYWEYILILEIG